MKHLLLLMFALVLGSEGYAADPYVFRVDEVVAGASCSQAPIGWALTPSGTTVNVTHTVGKKITRISVFLCRAAFPTYYTIYPSGNDQNGGFALTVPITSGQPDTTQFTITGPAVVNVGDFYFVYCYFDDFPAGPQGPAGPTGATGPQGLTGATWTKFGRWTIGLAASPSPS